LPRQVVITGGASGIGAGTAALLWAQGHRVIGVDRAGAEIVADLSTEAGCAGMARAVAAVAPQGIDAIVANAGVLEPDALCYAVNYWGAVHTLTMLRPLLAGSAAPRALVTASMAVSTGVGELADAVGRGETPEAPFPGAAYAASKLAILRWARAQAVSTEWAGGGILLNVICPGVIRTPMGETALQNPAASALLASTPLGRIGEPADIAAAIAFLVSAECSFLTGQALFVDGGLDALLRPHRV
jgi:NAD(P)-dependent dehydrogenase (short-subunit alcohol dehydrogenase family)